ncbi:hypothetical protein OK016_00515 [Vibrio chagasii]|nr:hypothetical protein [Vibrio chagasii]
MDSYWMMLDGAAVSLFPGATNYREARTCLALASHPESGQIRVSTKPQSFRSSKTDT